MARPNTLTDNRATAFAESPRTETTSKTLTGNNTTVATPIFTVTGSVEILALYAVITTVLGSNVTATHFRLNDQTAQPVITAAAGTALSSLAAGSWFYRRGLAATALTAVDNAAGRVNESTATNLDDFSPVVLTKKLAATTQVEFVYTTTNTPTSGVISFFAKWRALSADGDLVGV